MENPIEMDDLGVPLFSETSIWRQTRYIFEAGASHGDQTQEEVVSSQKLERSAGDRGFWVFFASIL